MHIAGEVLSIIPVVSGNRTRGYTMGGRRMEFEIKKLNVLIADDHFAIRQMVGTIMRAQGIEDVQVANDGSQTREMIERAHSVGKPFHLVYLDWNMPGINGFEILKHFRAQPAFNNTAFVMLTAKSLQKDVLDAVKSGATSYMVKPVSQAAIVKKLNEVCAWLEHRKTTV